MTKFAFNPPAPGGRPSSNQTLEGDGFYVSYNDHDIGIYGCDTTALVLGQMQRFLVLKGDHREQYASLVDQGLHACLTYFKARPGERHRISDKIEDIPDDLLPRAAEEVDGPEVL